MRKKNGLLFISGLFMTIVAILGIIASVGMCAYFVLEILEQTDLLTSINDTVVEYFVNPVMDNFYTPFMLTIMALFAEFLPDSGIPQMLNDNYFIVSAALFGLILILNIIFCVLGSKKRRFSTFQPQDLQHQYGGAKFSIIFFQLQPVIFCGGIAAYHYFNLGQASSGELEMVLAIIGGVFLLWIIWDIIGLIVGAKAPKGGHSSNNNQYNNNMTEAQFFGGAGSNPTFGGDTNTERQMNIENRNTNLYSPNQNMGQPAPSPYAQAPRPAPYQASPYAQAPRPAGPAYNNMQTPYGQQMSSYPQQPSPYAQAPRPASPAPYTPFARPTAPAPSITPNPSPVNPFAAKPANPTIEKQDNSSLLTAKLKELSALKANGNISEEEYKDLKQKAFQKFLNNGGNQ